ncbi:MAG: sulfatase [Armatimonadota bacterium]
MPRDRPHILIIMPDQQRADCLSCAGHRLLRTPNMDRLAHEGVRFSHAFTVSPLCMPARASFVSGLYPHNHGIWHNAGSLPPDDETFFHHLQRLGYYTAYVGKSHFYSHGGRHLREYEDYMRARGLDYVHETTGPWATVRTDSYMTDHWAELGLLEAFRSDYEQRRAAGPCAVWPSPLPADEFLDSYIGRQAVEWTDGHDGDQPVCLFVGFGGPHEPWDAPGEYATMYDLAGIPAAIPASDPPPWATDKAARFLQARVAGMSEADVRRLRANYYGKIGLLDHWVGEILAAFERRGWLGDALVVLWSDHGEMAGDHGRLHKSVFYESAVRVPLILRWPGRILAGRTSEALVENIDVFPTILEAVGAEPSKRCLGRSLWPVLLGEEQEHRQAVFSEVDSITMVRTRSHKYAMDAEGDGFMLYDLTVDPEERTNLVGKADAADTETDLRDCVLRWLAGTQVRQR